MFEKANIQELKYRWDNDFGESDNNHEDVLEGLKPHRNVKGLEIQNFGGRGLASWMSKDACLLQNLVKIILKDCRLCEQVPALGHLLHLEKITIYGLQNLKCIGPEFYGQYVEINCNCSSSEGAAAREVFPALRKLKLYEMPQLKEWSNESSLPKMKLFPRLQKLYIQACPELISIPAFKGSNSLQELEIESCGELTCLSEGVLQPTLLRIDIRTCPKLITLNPNDEIEGAFNGSTSLQQLVIYDCPELITLPEGVLQPTILKIDIRRCPKLKTLTPIDESKAAFNGSMCLQQLRIYDCPELIILPAWVLQPTLIDIDIQRCPKLKMLNPIDKIAAAFNSLTSLRRLWICDCPELTLQGFKGSTSLEEFVNFGCTELTCLPEGVLQPTLLKIDIRRCPKLKMLNRIDESEAAFNGSMSLQQLVIYDCPELITLPGFKGSTSLEEFIISGCTELTCLPEGVLQPTLLKIDIRGCPKLKTLTPIDKSEAAFNGSMCLQQLLIYDCPELITLPAWVLQSTLVKIDIQQCPKLKMLNPIDKIVAAFNGLTSLRQLWICDCPELTLPEAAFKGSTSLEELTISGCTELTCLPEGVLQPTLIDIRLLYCPKLKTPDPDALRTLTSLKKLFIRSCSNWGSFWEEGLFCTTSLQELGIGEFGKEYRYFPWPSRSAASPSWSHLTSLEELILRGWPEVTSLPDELELLSALRTLAILNFSGLKSLPEWLGKLSSLESLSISGCPLLLERCEKGIGEDWHKIAHIPSIEIDKEKIQ